MSFGDHLEDLRRRLLISLLGLMPIFILSMVLGLGVLEMLIAPVQSELRAAGLPAALLATSPLETFLTYVRIAIVLTILVGSPWVLIQLWMFVSPGLYASERRFIYILAPMSAALTTAGVLFLYKVILPIVLAFFIQFGSGVGQPPVTTAPLPPDVTLGSIPILQHDPPNPPEGSFWINTSIMQLRVVVGEANGRAVVLGSELTRAGGILQQYRISEYVRLFLSLALGFSLGFQMPVVVLLLGWAGIVTPASLRKYRKHAMLGCVAASALLTPADPISMVFLALPLYLLYEFGGLLLRILPASRVADPFGREKRHSTDDDDGEPT